MCSSSGGAGQASPPRPCLAQRHQRDLQQGGMAPSGPCKALPGSLQARDSLQRQGQAVVAPAVWEAASLGYVPDLAPAWPGCLRLGRGHVPTSITLPG